MSAIDILREKGLKKSAQRISIINILLDKQIPLTESDIKAEMGDMYDRITFYRTNTNTVGKGCDSSHYHRQHDGEIRIEYSAKP